MLVLTKAAQFAAVALAAAGVAIPATPAAAGKTICVGLVVDARPLGGPVSAQCTTVSDGSTGYDVLRAAGHTVGFRQDGLICSIDNRPADGCAATDAQHFWAYFHRAPHSSSWSYSNEGATTYKPGNGETEGWVWRNGDSATPKDVAYSAICPRQPSASPAPTAAPPPTASAPPSASPQRTKQSASAAAPLPRTHRVHARERRRRSTPTPMPSRTPAAVVAVSSAHDGGSSGPPWGLLAGVAAAVVLGGAAAVRWRGRAGE